MIGQVSTNLWRYTIDFDYYYEAVDFCWWILKLFGHVVKQLHYISKESGMHLKSLDKFLSTTSERLPTDL